MLIWLKICPFKAFWKTNLWRGLVLHFEISTEYDQHFKPLIRRARPVVTSPGFRIYVICKISLHLIFDWQYIRIYEHVVDEIFTSL